MRISSALAGAVAAGLIAAAPAPAAFTGTNGRIAMQGASRIDTMNASGGDRRTVIGDPGHSFYFAQPSWSPDGQRIAFTTNRDGNGEIYVMGAEGTAVTRLTTNAAEDGAPTWSPDGTRIAFESERDTAAGSGRAQIYVMGADGTGVMRLSSSIFDDRGPSWSPDGSRVAFARGTAGGDHDIWTTGAAGGLGSKLIGDAGTDEVNPDWSPDGTRIAFERPTGVVVAAADGGGATPLPLAPGAQGPAWSPDATRIAYEVTLELFSANPDGSGITQLTMHGSPDLVARFPSWQPIPIPQPGAGPGDADGDKSPVPLDCNDANPRIHPGAKDTPGDGIDQDCAGGDARFRILDRTIIAYTATYPAGYMTFVSMTVKPVRKGDRLVLTCKGRGCRFKKHTVKVRKRARKRSLMPHLRGMKLRRGAVVQLRVTRPATIGRVATWKVRAPRIPKTTRNCIRPGARKPGRCRRG